MSSIMPGLDKRDTPGIVHPVIICVIERRKRGQIESAGKNGRGERVQTNKRKSRTLSLEAGLKMPLDMAF